MGESEIIKSYLVLNTTFKKEKESSGEFKAIKKYLTDKGIFYEVLYRNWFDGSETVEIISEAKFAKL